jgi:tripartite motif-containing protein 71
MLVIIGTRTFKSLTHGNFITKWGTNGTEDGQFLNIGDESGVEGIDVDSLGNVYVADSGNSRIQKFDSDGNFVTKWGTKGTGNGRFIYPSGLAADSNDNVYVSDEGRKDIQKFDSNGNFMTKWGSPGYEDGQFGHNHYIDVDSENNVYVADPGFEYDPDNEDAGFVQKFDSDGEFITKMTD